MADFDVFVASMNVEMPRRPNSDIPAGGNYDTDLFLKTTGVGMQVTPASVAAYLYPGRTRTVGEDHCDFTSIQDAINSLPRKASMVDVSGTTVTWVSGELFTDTSYFAADKYLSLDDGSTFQGVAVKIVSVDSTTSLTIDQSFSLTNTLLAIGPTTLVRYTILIYPGSYYLGAGIILRSGIDLMGISGNPLSTYISDNSTGSHDAITIDPAIPAGISDTRSVFGGSVVVSNLNFTHIQATAGAVVNMFRKIADVNTTVTFRNVKTTISAASDSTAEIIGYLNDYSTTSLYISCYDTEWFLNTRHGTGLTKTLFTFAGSDVLYFERCKIRLNIGSSSYTVNQNIVFFDVQYSTFQSINTVFLVSLSSYFTQGNTSKFVSADNPAVNAAFSVLNCQFYWTFKDAIVKFYFLYAPNGRNTSVYPSGFSNLTFDDSELNNTDRTLIEAGRNTIVRLMGFSASKTWKINNLSSYAIQAGTGVDYVQQETVFGSGPSFGDSMAYSRSNHRHGVPRLPLTYASQAPTNPREGDLWIETNLT